MAGSGQAPSTGSGRGAPAYAVYALDRDTGDRVWRFQAGRHLHAPPLVAEDTILVGSDDGMLYALDAGTGAPLWQVETQRKVQSTPARAGNHLFFGSRDGEMFAVAWRAAAQDAGLRPAEAYRVGTEWELAGIAAALAGDFAAAAGDFLRLSRPYYAAQLYSLAGEWEQAAPLYLEAEQPGQAVEAFRSAGDRPGEAGALMAAGEHQAAGELYEELGQLAPAAGAYEKAGLMVQAAICHAQAGNRERAVDIYLALNEPEPAAKLCQDAGEVDRAVAILREAGLEKKAVRVLVEDGRHADGAALLEEAGRLEEAVAIWRSAADLPEAAAVHERAGDWEQAADLWAEAGQLERAADLFRRAGQLWRAAELYERMGELDQAIQLYEQLNAAERIARLREDGEDWEGAAAAYLGIDPPQPVEAARCYCMAEQWEKAVPIYESLQMPADAARCWVGAGRPDKAAEAMLEAGKKREAAELLEEAGEHVRAAEIWEELRELDQAVRLYRRAGQDGRALDLLADSGAWKRVRVLADELGEHEREARACTELAKRADAQDAPDLMLAAAQALVRAARGQEGRKPDEQVAGLWEQAVECHKAGFGDPERIVECHREALRLRRWPEIVVEVEAAGELVEREFHTLVIRVTNAGHGLACMISARVVSDTFEGDAQHTQQIGGLRPGQTRDMHLRVRPNLDAVGTTVPLDIEISYELPNRQEFASQIRCQVPVRRRDPQITPSLPWTPTGEITPSTVFNISGGKVQVLGREARAAEGDLIEAGGYKGDKVEIRRGSQPGIVAGEEDPPVAGRCSACGAEYLQGERFCGACRERVG